MQLSLGVVDTISNSKKSKTPPFYITMKIMGIIVHFCLIDGGIGPNVMSKIIMDDLGLTCTNEILKPILTFNKKKQPTIGEIKDFTLVMCPHPKIRASCNIQVLKMGVSNYSIILGREWESLIGGSNIWMAPILLYQEALIT